MKTWVSKFWYGHGERLIYCLLVVILAVGFMLSSVEDLSKSAPTLLIAVATLFLNKARGSSIEHNKEETPDDSKPIQSDPV